MSTLSIRSRLSALRTLYRAGRLSLHVTLAGAVLEAAIYLLAWYDLTRQARIDGCWETSSSAKTEFSPPA